VNKAKGAFIAVLVFGVVAASAVSSSATVVTSGSLFTFDGFFEPISNDAVNAVNAGQAVPLKFSLGGDYGLDVLADGYPRVQDITGHCDSLPVVEIPPTAGLNEDAVSNNGLSYDAGSGTYTYVWKTSKLYAHRCWQLILKFDDGTKANTNFIFD
jgi:hypothetical protein